MARFSVALFLSFRKCSHRSKFFRQFALSFALFAMFSQSGAHAQGPPTITPDDQMSFMPYVSYHGGDIDNVNVVTGNLVVNLPFVMAGAFFGDELAASGSKVEMAAVREASGEAVPETAGTASQLQINKAAGDAFRDKVAGSLKAAGRDVKTEVTKQGPSGPGELISRSRIMERLLVGGRRRRGTPPTSRANVRKTRT